MAQLIRNKLRGSILEPLIALMIILFALTSAFTVVIRANQLNNIPLRVLAQQIASSSLNTAIHNKLFIDEEIRENGLRIEKLFDWYDREKGLLTCKVNVYDNKDKLLTSRIRVVIYYEK